jgi:hypothetical protein
MMNDANHNLKPKPRTVMTDEFPDSLVIIVSSREKMKDNNVAPILR